MNKIAKVALSAVGAVGAVAAVAAPASAGTPLPPDGVDKYDCLVSVPLLDQTNPLVVGALACNGKKAEDQAPGHDQDGPGNSENAPGRLVGTL